MSLLRSVPLSKWIWIILTLGLTIPLIYPLGISLRTAQSTIDYYNVIEDAPPGSLALLKWDPSPGFFAEFEAWSASLFYHCVMNDLKVVIYTSNDYSVAYNTVVLQSVEDELPSGYEYGTHYVDLGYIPGIVVSTVTLSERPQEATQTDARGNNVMSLALMQEFDSGDDVYVLEVDGLDNVSAGVTYFRERYGTKVITASAAAAISENLPFYQTGQIDGMLGAIHGFAEYEQLIGRPWKASAQMDAQSIGHLVILLGLIAGNVTYFMRRARGAEDERIGWHREI